MTVNFKELGAKLRALFATRGYTCDCCNKEIFNYPTKRLCEDCECALPSNDKGICPKCGRKLISQGVCLICKKEAPAFERGISPLVYEGIAASLINRFKNGERYLAWLLSEKMAEVLIKSDKYSDRLLVVNVPMTEEKIRERGYNQAEELAALVAQKCGLEFDAEVLQKRRETSEQKHLTRDERKKNLEGSFLVHKRKLVRDRSILLVDDIMTTGATGNECARILLSAGAKEVIFLTAVSLKEQK